MKSKTCRKFLRVLWSPQIWSRSVHPTQLWELWDSQIYS